MGLFDNVERAARDPHYRILFEHQQRQDKITREVAQTLERASSTQQSRSDAQTSPSLFPHSASFGSSTSGSDSEQGFAIGVGIGTLGLLGFYVFSVIAAHIYLALIGTAVLAVLAFLIVLVVRHWATIGVVITVPLMCVCWATGLWIAVSFGCGELTGTAVASLPALCLGTVIRPRRGIGDGWLFHLVACAQWLSAFVTFFFVFVEAALSWKTGTRLGVAFALVAAGWVWTAFHIVWLRFLPGAA